MTRRKSVSRAVWRQRVDLFLASGKTYAEFAAQENLNVLSLKHWRYKFDKERRLANVDVDSAATSAPVKDTAAQFVELKRPPAAQSNLRIRLHGAELEVPAGVDETALTTVLGALRKAKLGDAS